MERSAFKAFEKGKWEKGKRKIDKVFQKSRYPVAAWYTKAVYYFDTSNPGGDLDSAHTYLQEAISQYQDLPVDFRKPLSKFPIDSIILGDLRFRIDSAAFERAYHTGTEESYNDFLRRFPDAVQREEAIARRDTVAFENASSEGTHEAMSAYLERYPHSAFYKEAQSVYDRLLFRASTGDQRLSSFIAFLTAHPDSPFRGQVEEQIFQIATASGSVAAFKQYLRDHPSGPWADKAMNILYHVIRELDQEWPETELQLPDSLARIGQLNREYLVPFQSDGHFNFMNQEGKVVLTTRATEVSDDYLCGNVYEDVLVVDDQLMSRDGSVIFSGSIESVDDLGFGFLLIDSAGCGRVIHKSGFVVSEQCVGDAFVVNANFLALNDEEGWFLYTLGGRLLFESAWDDIKTCHGLVALKRNHVWQLTTADDLARVADQQPLYATVTYDSIEAWPRNLVWVRSGERQGVFDSRMETKIALAEQQLEYAAIGVKVTTSRGERFYDQSFKPSAWYQTVVAHNRWIGARENTPGSWRVFTDANPLSNGGEGYDTVTFEGVFALGIRGDSTHVYCETGRNLRFKKVNASFLPSKDSTAFILVARGSRKMVYDGDGQKLFEGVYDQVQYAEDGYFIVSRAEHKGLVDHRGRALLPVQFHAIGEVSNGRVPLLKNMKFGIYDINTKKQLTPKYDKNLMAYNKELLIAFRNGKYGLIDMNDRQRAPFEYDEISHWNDSVALIRQNSRWKLIGLNRLDVLYDDIRSIRWVSESEKEKIIIYRTGNGFGVLSNRRGVLIPDAFSDIVNLGSFVHPLYFTEKHVEEASIFVVVYYDKDGRSLRRQVCDPDTYDKIYCSDH